MTIDWGWQFIVAAVLVIGSAAYALRSLWPSGWRRLRRDKAAAPAAIGACGGCTGCSAGSGTNAATNIVKNAGPGRAVPVEAVIRIVPRAVRSDPANGGVAR